MSDEKQSHKRLIEAVQEAYESMPEADQKECVGVFLDMITAGVKAAREGRE